MTPQLLGGLALALGSAAALNWSYLLQHGAATELPPLTLRHPVRSLRSLFSDPTWVVGFVTGIGGWVLYVVALALAPLSLVQATAAGGIGLLALLVHRRTGARLPRRDWIAVGVAVTGLVLLGDLACGRVVRGEHAILGRRSALWLARLCRGGGARRRSCGTAARGRSRPRRRSGQCFYAAGDVGHEGGRPRERVAARCIPALLACHGLAFVALAARLPARWRARDRGRRDPADERSSDRGRCRALRRGAAGGLARGRARCGVRVRRRRARRCSRGSRRRLCHCRGPVRRRRRAGQPSEAVADQRPRAARPRRGCRGTRSTAPSVSVSATGPTCDRSAVAQQERVRRRGGQLLEVVGRDHDRERGLVAGEAVERGEQRLAAREVEARTRLVEQQQPRPRDERPRDQRALALALRAVAEPPLADRTEPERAEEAVGAGRGRARRAAPRSSRSSPSRPCGSPARTRQERSEAVADRARRRIRSTRAAGRRRCVPSSRRGSRPCPGSRTRPRRRASAASSCRRRSGRGGPSARRARPPSRSPSSSALRVPLAACQRQTSTSSEAQRARLDRGQMPPLHLLTD